MKLKIFGRINVIENDSKNRENQPLPYRNKVYFFKAKESILDNLLDRHTRPYELYKEHLFPSLMLKLQKQYPKIYKLFKKEKFGWRQRCGCSCPCSPGFVGTQNDTVTIHVNYIIEHNVKALNSKTTFKKRGSTKVVSTKRKRVLNRR